MEDCNFSKEKNKFTRKVLLKIKEKLTFKHKFKKKKLKKAIAAFTNYKNTTGQTEEFKEVMSRQ